MKRRNLLLRTGWNRRYEKRNLLFGTPGWKPVRLAGLARYWFVKKYCWLIWCERKILFRLEIYDRLRPSEQGAVTEQEWVDVLNSYWTRCAVNSVVWTSKKLRTKKTATRRTNIKKMATRRLNNHTRAWPRTSAVHSAFCIKKTGSERSLVENEVLQSSRKKLN